MYSKATSKVYRKVQAGRRNSAPKKGIVTIMRR